MRLWIVTSPDDFAAEYDDIEEMFKRGLTRLILHKRSRRRGFNGESGEGLSSLATAEEYERWLLSLPMEYRDRIWVRGTPDMAEQLDVRGCVTEAERLMGDVPESFKRVNCVALCKSYEEALKLPAWVSGALLGPVFQPFSAMELVKTVGVYPVQPSNEISDIPNSGNCRSPLILWGGMEPEILESVKCMNPSGVACLGGIWNYADPINAFIKMNRACGIF